MGNDYFRFKEFTIHQSQSAMRVTTDACILGAWVARDYPTSGRVLDIGSGTGLLMLMMAQQMNGSFTGVELDPAAYHESRSNVDQSPWSARIKVMHEDIKTFGTELPYDLIVSNPPFYNNDLQRPNAAQNLAMHGAELTLEDLVIAINRLLTADGKVIILLPPHRAELICSLMSQAGMFEIKVLAVRHSRNHRVLRKISVFSRKKEDVHELETLDIRESDGAYTDAFTELMKPYYLFL
jgi:tRNA1Val (adenine37-N6)-methyltransferase